jgi:excinuclease ABC subunit C
VSKADRPEQPGAAERFNEDQATYAVRGAEQPDLEKGVAAIREVLRTLPVRPGVYRMQDSRGDVLYVGKARALKNRVTNYTQVARLPKRLQRMVAQTRSMTIVTTRTEAEALLLEAQLIKRFRPAYNVLLRDDKSFPFILLREDHAFPRVQKHRGARRAKGQYFGPFASAGSVTRTLNALQKLFLLRSCSDSYFENRSRPCLLYQIKRCSAPCVGRISEADYDELVEDAKNFLSGKSTGVQARLSKQMAAAAEKQDYELAAVYRDRLRALTYIQGSQTVHAEGSAMPTCSRWPARPGRCRSRASSSAAGRTGGIAPSSRAYQRRPGSRGDVELSRPILRGLAAAEADSRRPRARRRDVLEEALSNAAAQGRHRGPQARRPQEAARPGAAQRGGSARPPLAETTTQGKILRELADTFELADVPKRIEVYDNSHIMGTNATGAMIVAGPEASARTATASSTSSGRRRTRRRLRDDARGARAPLRSAGEGRPLIARVGVAPT